MILIYAVLIQRSFHGTAVDQKDIEMVKKGDSYELKTNPKFD
jgi:hypothetical protein